MQDKIVVAIAKALSALGVKYKVYVSKIKQDLSLPCFIIHTINSMHTPGIAKRKGIITTLSITYYPETEDEDELRNIMNATTTLFDLIEIEPGKYLRGYHLDFNISDGCLVCTVEYKTNVIFKSDSNAMEIMHKRGVVR